MTSAHTNARGILTVMLILLLAAAGVVGWRWLMAIPVGDITVAGEHRASPDDIITLAAVDTSVTLYRLDRDVVSDRVRRHPWVEDASVLRLPTGTMRIDVDERRVAAQVLDASGRLAFYLDPTGAMMPAPDTVSAAAWEDVPVVSGLADAYHPMHSVDSPALGRLLEALTELPDRTHSLISEILIEEDGVALILEPVAGRPSIRVRMGTDDFERRFELLDAFWRQQVLRSPDTRYDSIDLRFDGQLITRERSDSSERGP